MARTLAFCGFLEKHQTKGGVASYLQNILRGIHELVAQDPQYRDVHVTVLQNEEAPLPYSGELFETQLQRSNLRRFGADTKFGLFESQKFDVVLFPNYFIPPIVRSKRCVVTIHDLLYKNMPELVERKRRIWMNCTQHFSLRRADAIITISGAVKEDIVRLFGQKLADKIHPIWNPVAFERLDGESRSTITKGRPYLLGVGLDRPNKNLGTLVRAFAKLRSRHPDYCLVMVGDLRSRLNDAGASAKVQAEMPAAIDVVRELRLEEHVKLTGFVSDAELGALYRGATAFVLPSLFEGLGLPALEALAVGVPTVVSDIPALREVTGELARYLEQPRDVDSVCNVLDQVINDGDAARLPPETVAEIRRRFSPETAARKYMKLLFNE